MLARSVSILLTDNSLAYTLVTALTSRKNRPLIPALSISVLAVGKWIEILLLSFRIGKRMKLVSPVTVMRSSSSRQRKLTDQNN